MESPEAMRRTECQSAATTVLCECALKHGGLASAAESLVAAARRLEHVPAIAAAIAAHADDVYRTPELVSVRCQSMLPLAVESS